MTRRKRHKASVTMNNLLHRMPVTGYMRFNLDSADDPAEYERSVVCTGDFTDPTRRANILGAYHHYKFTVALRNYSGLLLSESDHYIPEPINYYEFEQIIRMIVNEQADEFNHRQVLSGKHSTIQISVYNPNKREHL